MKTVSLENKLQHILDNAVNNSPYYSKLRGIVDVTDIKSFPLLKKTDVHTNKAEILNTHYSNDPLYKNIPYNIEQVLTGRVDIGYNIDPDSEYQGNVYSVKSYLNYLGV